VRDGSDWQLENCLHFFQRLPAFLIPISHIHSISTAYSHLPAPWLAIIGKKCDQTLAVKGFSVVEKLGKVDFDVKVGKSVTLCEKVEKLSHGRISW
jgi:hypothetical protein